MLVGYEHDGAPEFRSTEICAGPGQRHFFQGTWHPGLYPSGGETPDEAAQWERFWDLLLELDVARDESGELLFRLPVRRSAGRLRALDRVTMAAWLDEQGLLSWRLRWYVDYACRDEYGCSVEQTSAFAGLHHFLGRGLEQTRDGALLTWAGGNGELIAGMQRRLDLGARLRRDHLVYELEPGDAVGSGRVLEHMHPAMRRMVTQLHVHRWGHAMIRPVPGLLFGGALDRARA